MKKLIFLLYAISVALIAAGLRLEFEGTDSLFGYSLAFIGGIYLIAAAVMHWSLHSQSYWTRRADHGQA